jgi:hypothetical protein
MKLEAGAAEEAAATGDIIPAHVHASSAQTLSIKFIIEIPNSFPISSIGKERSALDGKPALVQNTSDRLHWR